MGASNYQGLKFAKPRARALEADEEVRAARSHELTVYAEIDRRDERRCTCCGRRGNPNATTTIGKLHHEHLVEKSLGGATSLENVTLTCWICHPFKTAHELMPKGNPEKGTLRYTVTPAAAAVIFKKRPIPRRVQVVKVP